MLTARDAILQQMQNVVMACGVPGGESRLSDKSGTFEPGGDLVHWFTDLKKNTWTARSWSSWSERAAPSWAFWFWNQPS